MDHDSPQLGIEQRELENNMLHKLHSAGEESSTDPPKQVKCLPREFPLHFCAQPEKTPLQITRRNKQANKNPQKKNQTSTQTTETPKPQFHISFPKFSQRSCFCPLRFTPGPTGTEPTITRRSAPSNPSILFPSPKLPGS